MIIAEGSRIVCTLHIIVGHGHFSQLCKIQDSGVPEVKGGLMKQKTWGEEGADGPFLKVDWTKISCAPFSCVN